MKLEHNRPCKSRVPPITKEHFREHGLRLDAIIVATKVQVNAVYFGFRLTLGHGISG